MVAVVFLFNLFERSRSVETYAEEAAGKGIFVRWNWALIWMIRAMDDVVTV